MLNALNVKLESVETTEAFIINKTQLNGDSMKLTISRKVNKNDDTTNKYTGHCIAELKLADEEELDMLDCSFYVKVSLIGLFICNEEESVITEERMQATVMLELLPHVRACMASMMASVGMTPYMIPNTIIPELS